MIDPENSEKWTQEVEAPDRQTAERMCQTLADANFAELLTSASTPQPAIALVG